MSIWAIVLVLGWAIIASKIVDNFAADLERMPLWRQVALQAVILVFAPVFFIEELLEILIDVIIGDDSDGE